MEQYGTIPKIAYVVVEIGWEYNDEYYYRGESGGGNPVKVFLSKDSADFECEKLNKQRCAEPWAKEMCTEEGYNYDTDEIDPIKEHFEVVEVEVA